MLPEDKRLRTKEQLKQWLACEKKRYGRIGKLEWLLQYSERAVLYKHQILLRKCEYHYNSKHKLRYFLRVIRLKKLQNRYALHIPINTCAKGLHVIHIGPILINSACSVGENCSLHINTALVAGGTKHDVPVLGDNVVLGIGAVVLGKTRIADGVAVGANAVVNKDVTEPNIAVAGVPARKISNNGKDTWNKKD